ncbi:MAG: hypothetical protein LUQ38_06240 [Methanotrichaceae archaeon]|nr:hypothetical protein [Methanotrichaceae archaeon]MDD1757507.1 hypothetical protein [Methanotrichaceae archaeon]
MKQACRNCPHKCCSYNRRFLCNNALCTCRTGSSAVYARLSAVPNAVGTCWRSTHIRINVIVAPATGTVSIRCTALAVSTFTAIIAAAVYVSLITILDTVCTGAWLARSAAVCARLSIVRNTIEA